MKKQRGSLLIEIAIAMVVMSVLAIAAYPYILESVRVQTAQKIREDAREILKAADIFYSMNCRNPVVAVPTVANLQALELLKSTRVIVNPWGGNYVVTFNNPKTTRAQIVVTANFTTAQRANHVGTQSREARVVGTTVQWLKTPYIIEDLALIQSVEDQGLFGPKPCLGL
jgi:type II secretory pathway pseudopilin PulG